MPKGSHSADETMLIFSTVDGFISLIRGCIFEIFQLHFDDLHKINGVAFRWFHMTRRVKNERSSKT